MIATPVNFRDLGGIPGATGRRVKRGRLYRGGQLFALTDEEKRDFCGAHDIQVIVDLRNEESARAEPNGTIPGVEQRILEVMRDLKEPPKSGHLESAFAAECFLAELYAGLVTDAHAGRCFREILELLASARAGVYFHCFAGKDRTGVAAAILLTALGARREDVRADYMRSEECRREENRRILSAARAAGTPDGALAALEVLVGVKPRYLESAFLSAEKRFGSFERYVLEGIGVGGSVIDALRARYLE